MIPEGHREGLYIVVDRCEEGLICRQGTSVDQSEHLDLYLKLENLKYNLFKETHFKCADFVIINNYSFIEKIDELKEEDISILFKLIKKNGKNYYYTSDGYYRKFNIPFQIGDVVHNIKNYLIIDIKDNKLFCVMIHKSTEYLKYNIEFNDYKYLNYFNIVIFDINDKLEYLNTLDNNLLNYVLKKQKEYLKNIKNQTIAQRGSIIKKDNEIYYIYGEEGEDWLVMEICEKINPYMEKIMLNNITYYTSYNDLKINKKEEFEIIFLANESEINNIKNKKSLIKSKNNKKIIKK